MNEERYRLGGKLLLPVRSYWFCSFTTGQSVLTMMNENWSKLQPGIHYCKKEDMKALAENVLCMKVVNDMVVRFLPNPILAQKGRVASHLAWRSE